MKLNALTLAAFTVAALGLTACNGTANVTVPAGVSSAFLSAAGAFQDAFTSVETSAELRAKGSDLQAYRAESDPNDASVWVISYWSPSQNKSFRCRTNAKTHQVIDINETTDATQVYQANYQLDKTQVKVTPDTAAAAAVTSINNSNNTTNASTSTTVNNTSATTNVTNNITVNNITNVQVISAKECKDRTGRGGNAPVYVVVTANNKAYVDAATGQTITTTSATTPAPAPTPSAPATTTTTVGASAAANVNVGK
jgi:hypothetical protein